VPSLARPDCDLYYEVHGDGPPLVFAHGLGGNHLTWWQQLAHFAADYTCVTYSARGFGLSREAAGGPGPAAFADDLLALLDHLGLERVGLVAQSMGGWPSCAVAVRHPERVAGLVLANTTGSLSHPELDAIFARHLAANPESRFPPGVHPAAGDRMLREQPAMHFLYKMLDAMSPDIHKPTLQRALLGDLRTTPIGGLRGPLLCITSDEDRSIPPDAVVWLAEHVPGAILHVEPAAGHSVYWERPAVFNRIVGEFLATRVHPRDR
jgi:3-oxoadipate enol-lactonase